MEATFRTRRREGIKREQENRWSIIRNPNHPIIIESYRNDTCRTQVVSLANASWLQGTLNVVCSLGPSYESRMCFSVFWKPQIKYN